MRYPNRCNAGERYNHIFKVQTEQEAQEHLAALTEWHVRLTGKTEDEARSIELANIGYWAGYSDQEAFDLVLRLYGAKHPVFGNSYPDFQSAFNSGGRR